MKPLTKALIEGLTACDSDEMIIKTLVNMGFTPPPDKPDPPREPYRGWATPVNDGVDHYISKDTPGVRNSLNADAVELIEAGWCQMVPHDGSNTCPVDSLSRVIVEWKRGSQGIWKAGTINCWEDVTHYAVILPVEG